MLKLCIATTIALATLVAGEVKEAIAIGKSDSATIAKLDICGDNDAGLFVVQAGGFESAGAACRQYGGVLVDVTSANFLAVSRVAFRCSGPSSETWVRSWNGNFYQGACLAISTGPNPGAGSINPPNNCFAPRKALCQKVSFCEKERCDIRPLDQPLPFDRRAERKFEEYVDKKWERPCDKPCVDPRNDCKRDKCHDDLPCDKKDKSCCPPRRPCPPIPDLSCGPNCNCIDPIYVYNGNQLPSIGTDKEFRYLTTGNFTSLDGKLSIENNQLVINSFPYTQTFTNTYDNIKYALLATPQYSIPSGCRLSIHAKMKTRILGIDNHPFGDQVLDAQSDPRLASAGVFAVHLPTSCVWGLFATNTQIYAVYWRLTRTRPQLGDYAGYNFLIPVGDTTPDRLHNFNIVFDRAQNSITYYLDGDEVFSIFQNGFLYSRQFMISDFGGQQEAFLPTEGIQGGFGNFDFLNGMSPCNVQQRLPNGLQKCVFPPNEKGLVYLENQSVQLNVRDGVTPAQFVYNATVNPQITLFGQGAISAVKQFSVGICRRPGGGVCAAKL